MRLIRCEIMGFGCLRDKEYEFQAGLNPLEGSNGTGKTTLCEFLRAMFYGFPRAFGQDLEKNRRKKYSPWKGKDFGGSLVFETEGAQYRIERTFGEKPSQDSFRLYDLRTGLPSRDYSQNLGTELFGMDSDSFARCVYLPQLGERGSLSTDDIQVRLRSLVEETDDTRSCDDAIRALRARRTPLKAIKGRTGLVFQTEKNISRLEKELDTAKALQPQLEEEIQALTDARAEKERLEGEHHALQERLRLASEAAGRGVALRRQEQLTRDLAASRGRLKELVARYPNGLPSPEEVEEARKSVDACADLRARLTPDSAYREARERLESGKERFAQGIPSEEAFARCREHCGDYTRLQAAWNAEGLTREEKGRLAELEEFLAPGVPDDAFLEQAQAVQRTLEQPEESEDGLLPDDEQRLRGLERFFAPGVPTEEELNQRRDQLLDLQRQARERREPRPEPAPQTGHLPLIPALIGIVVALGLAALLRFIPSLGPAHPLLYLLPLAVLAADIVLTLRSVHPTEDTPAAEAARENLEEDQLEQDLISWLSQWFATVSNPSEQLPLLSSRREEYRTLLARQEALAQRARGREARRKEALAWWNSHLEPWFGREIPKDAPLRLRLACRDLQTLRRRQTESEEAIRALNDQLETTVAAISAFLAPYEGPVDPNDFQNRLNALQRDCDACRRDQELLMTWNSERDRADQALRAHTARLEAFAATWGVPGDSREALDRIREDLGTATRERRQIRELEEAMASFQEENRALLDGAPALPAESPDQLRNLDRQLAAGLVSLGEDILRREARIRNLREETDKIPELEDELQGEREKLQAAEKTVELLDETMNILQQARTNLNARYLSPLQQRFGVYLKRLLAVSPNSAALRQDLTVSLQRGGQLRDPNTLSAGQADLVQLCMRLALADTLFQREPPFLLLDDPFVNLDDRNTATALELLQDLSRERQILYFYCHSSRAVPEEQDA